MKATIELYDRLRLSDAAVAKALQLSEVAQMARAERRIRELLLAFWKRHASKAAEVAAKQARAGKVATDINAAVEAELWRWAKAVLPKVQDEVEGIYRLARAAGWKKGTGQTRASLSYDTPHMVEVTKAKPRKGFEVAPSFDTRDRNAIDQLRNHQVFWVGEHYDQNVSASVATATRGALLEAGADLKTAGKKAKSAVKRALGRVITPGGFNGTTAQYFEGLAANAATVARAFGQLSSFMRVGATRYTIVNPSDSRTCRVCSHMNGKTFSVPQGAAVMSGALAAVDPNGVKAAHPWVRYRQLIQISPKAGPGKLADSDALARANFSVPGFHFRCRCGLDVDASAGFGTPIMPTDSGPAPKLRLPTNPGPIARIA